MPPSLFPTQTLLDYLTSSDAEFKATRQQTKQLQRSTAPDVTADPTMSSPMIKVEEHDDVCIDPMFTPLDTQPFRNVVVSFRGSLSSSKSESFTPHDRFRPHSGPPASCMTELSTQSERIRSLPGLPDTSECRHHCRWVKGPSGTSCGRGLHPACGAPRK